MNPLFEYQLQQSRRQFFASAGLSLGGLALGMCQGGAQTRPPGANAPGSPITVHPALPGLPHFPGKAKRVIFIYMSGGVSHVDSFDPKPRLYADHGKEIKADHPEIKNRPGYERIFLKRPQWTFAPRVR